MSVRPAATVVVAREAEAGEAAAGPPSSEVEVLVVRRSAASRFAPGFVVFPGGAVEAGDAELSRRWFGTGDQAARACALRELAEETGLVVTTHGLVAAPGRLPGEPGLPPPDPGAVPEVARWIAPEFLPVRFDARFFAVASDRGLKPHPDGIEVDQARWAVPRKLLDGGRTGDVLLMWPTLKTLEALAECATVQDVMELRVSQVPPARSAR